MKKILIPIVGICTMLSVFSCKKTNNNASSVVGTTPSLNQLFAGLRSTPQTISVTAGRDTMVFGAAGTMLYFYSNSFKDGSGNTINSGTIDLHLVEMYKPGDMIRNRATTMCGKNLLKSGGQIQLTASMASDKVYVNKYRVGFIQPSYSPQFMNLFYGGINNGDSVVVWNEPDTSKQRNWAEMIDSGNVISNVYGRSWVGFVFDSASGLEYTNCDAFYGSDSPKVAVSVKMPDNTFTAANTQVFLVLPDINCAMSTVEPTLGSAGYDAATNTIKLISESQTAIVPAGMNYKLIVMANKNGQYYFYQQSGTIPHNGLVGTATMTADTEGNIKTILSGL